MSNVALLKAARGWSHSVTEDDEEMLEELYLFFEKLRGKANSTQGGAAAAGGHASAGPRLAVQKKLFSLPKNLTDWFVPRGAARPYWEIDKPEDELQLYENVAELHRKGVPTFLREQPRTSLMKLFMSVEAFVRDDCVPKGEAERTQFWETLRLGVVRFVVSGMADVVLRMFGTKQHENLVAVLDASGFSPAELRWKLSLRINFLEIAVAGDTARHARGLIAERLTDQWAAEPQEAWAGVLEAVDHRLQDVQAALVPLTVGAASSGGRTFWDCAIDERALSNRAVHRLVWCDLDHGELGFPEDRPLKPLDILFVRAKQDGPAEISARRDFVDGLLDRDWVRLGSSHTPKSTATDYWNVPERPVAAAASAPALAAAPARAGNTNEWYQFTSGDGRPYYHQPILGQTLWELPEGAVLAQPQQQQQQPLSQPPQWRLLNTETGVPYYHNTVTNVTAWELPEGASIIDAAPGVA